MAASTTTSTTTDTVTTGRWRVEVDTTACIGSGVCAQLAPDALVRSGRTTAARADTLEPSDAVRDAVDSCPVEALLVRDTATGDVVAPEPEGPSR